MSSFGLLLILLLYLGSLFFVAQWAEKKGNSKWTNNPYVYSLSLAVYCTTWTYYGSIGVAANSGLNYIPIYLGPVMIFPAWILILKKSSAFLVSIKFQVSPILFHCVTATVDFWALSNGHFYRCDFALYRFATESHF
jgi:hypothetical protein